MRSRTWLGAFIVPVDALLLSPENRHPDLASPASTAVITPRRTRLVRVEGLHAFRHALVHLARAGGVDRIHSRLVIVPTQGAARQLRRTMGEGTPRPELVTRDELYDRLRARFIDPPRMLSAYERDVMIQASAKEASTESRLLRPGLVAEMLRFYDQLRRQARQVERFKELLEETLADEGEVDRGAARVLAQTRMLAATFRGYERRVLASGACDEHTLRDRLMADPAPQPIRDVIVTIGDWIADPQGLYLADFDLLTRLPGIEAIDLVATERLLASGFHERVHQWLPGIEEVEGDPAARQPVLETPPGDSDRLVWAHRDREEELVAVARRIATDTGMADSLDRVAVVYKQPLPYLYLAPAVFGGARILYQSSDGFPLAAEPFAAALDLVFECVESGFTRRSLVALLRSPHFVFAHDGRPLGAEAIAALDRGLSERRSLGGLDRLVALAATWPPDDVAAPALFAACAAAERLSPLLRPGPASAGLRLLLAFIDEYGAPIDVRLPSTLRQAQGRPERSRGTTLLRPGEADATSTQDSPPNAADDSSGAAAGRRERESRLQRAQAVIRESLESLAGAHAAHDDPIVPVADLTASVRRFIEEQIFVPDSSEAGVYLVDDQAARYGGFDEMAVVGLIEGEWPERPRRNIFYSSSLLASLGWPSEKDRRAAAEARFVDLLASASRRVTVSTVTLDDDATVEASAFVDSVPRAPLLYRQAEPSTAPPSSVLTEEILAIDPVSSMNTGALDPDAREWLAMRLARSSPDGPTFHGQTGPLTSRPWSVSALETYLGCPFKFFAKHVLGLEEEPEDEDVMNPRARGAFVHKVFEAFFARWQAEGRRAITPDTLDRARRLFVEIVDEQLAALPDAEASLERTRLLGGPVAAGLAEAVLRMEAERPAAVIARLLEHRLDGEFTFQADEGPRRLALRAKADRVDLLEDGTFRLIDYKLGWPPDRSTAIQLPAYGLCLEQRLEGHLGRRWVLGEAAYLAFRGPKRVVPLFTAPADREKVLTAAQARLIDTVDAVSRGDFPPCPDDVFRCEACGYSAVCRKDYVGDV